MAFIGPTGPNDDDLLTEDQVAFTLGIRRCTVANERKRGRLGFVLIGARSVRIKRCHLREYLKLRESSPCEEKHCGPAKLENFGQARNLVAPGLPTPIASPGTMSLVDRSVIKALAQRTFKKQRFK